MPTQFDTMAQYLNLPNGYSVEIKEGETKEAALARAVQKYPEIFGFGKAAAPEAAAESGFTPALKSGVSELKAGLAALAGRSGIMDPAAAEKYIAEQEEYQKKTYKPTATFGEAPVTKTLELLGGSFPYMVAPLVVGGAASMAPVAAPVATALGVLGAGAASATQFTGSNLRRQMEEGKKLEETDPVSAALAAMPQAALDALSFKMIPGIRGILSAAGKEVTPTIAKKIAEQGAKEVLKDYALATGKAMGTEGLTEVGQQVLERMQAGLSLTDEKARDEYIDNLIGGVVLGGVLSPAGRYAERRGEAKKEEAEAFKKAVEDRAKETAAREAEIAKRQTPEGRLAFAQEYEGLLTRRAELQAVPKPAKDADPADAVAYREARKELADIKKRLEAGAQEYAAAKPVADAARQQQQAQEIAAAEAKQAEIEGAADTETQAGQYYYEPQQTLPGMEAAPSPVQAQEQEQVDYASQVRNLEGQLDALREQAQRTTSLDEKTKLAEKYAQFNNALQEAQRLQKEQERQAAGPDVKIKALLRKMEEAEDNGDIPTQAKVAAQLRELGFNSTEEARASLQPKGAQQAFPMFPFKGTSETGPEFAARVYQPGPIDIEAQEQEALAQAERDRQATAEEAARERRIAPEKAALQRIGERPAPTSPETNAALQAASKLEPGGSSVMGRTAQDLQGLQPGEQGSLIYTAEEEKPPAQPRRVPGEFRLFNERGEPVLDRAEMEKRIERLLLDDRLSDEARSLLQRIEKVLPQADYAQETERVGTDAQGRTVRNVARTEGLLKLVDKQLTQLERGLEGVSQRGAPRITELQGFPAQGAASTAAPTVGVKTDVEKRASAVPGQPSPIQVTQPAQGDRAETATGPAAVTKRVSDTQPTTLRGPSTQAQPLTQAAEIEPLLRDMERTADENAGQLPLFPTEEKKLGAIKPDAAAFQRLLNSPAVRKMRKALRAPFDKLVRANRELPKLQSDIAALQKKIADMQQAQAEYKSAEQVLKATKDISTAERSLAALNKRMTDLVVGRMQLEGDIEMLRTERQGLLNKIEKMEDVGPSSTEEARELNAQAAALEATSDALGGLQTESSAIETALGVLQAQVQAMKARNEIAALRERAPFPVDIEKAQAELRAKQAQAGTIDREARQVFAEEQRAQREEKRKAEARNRAEEEAARTKEREEKQRRFEAMYGESSSGLQYPAITEAQRAARDMGPPTLTAAETAQIDKDPVQVLGGYRSQQRTIEKRLQNSQERAKEARSKQLDGLRKRRDDLFAKYKAAKSAAERDVIGAQYDAAERTLLNAERKLSVEPLTWVGMKRDIAQLADVLNKIDDLEYKINNGLVSTPEERAPRQYIKKASAGERAAQEERANTEAAKEAATRANAPATSGAAVTKSEVTKLTKPQKTQYSSKGNPEVAQKAREDVARETTASAVVAATDEAQRQSRDALREAVQAKLDSGAKLNPFEKAILTYGKGGGAVYRTASQTGPGMQGTALDRLIMRITDGWKNIPTIVRADTFDALPEAIKQQAIADGVAGQIPGVYDPNTNTVYLVADQLHTAEDVVATVAHEITGHFGLRAMLGGAYAKTMNDIYEGNKAVREKADLKMSVMPSLSREVAVEEVLADMAEMPPAQQTPEVKSAVQRIVDAVKAWFQKTFGDKVSDAAVQQIVANARRYVIEGGKAAAGDIDTSGPVYRAKAKYANAEMARLGKDTEKLVRRQRSVWEKVKMNTTGMAFATQLVDRFAGFEKLAKYMDSLKGAQMMYYMRMYDERMHFTQQSVSVGALQRVAKTRADGRTEYVLEAKEKGANIKNVVEILKDAKPMVGNAEAVNRMFTMYLAALRAERVGLSKLNFGPEVTEDVVKRVKDQVESNKQLKDIFTRARNEYNTYNRDMMAFLADTGAISKELAKKLGDTNDYIPYYREQGGNAMLMIGGETPFKIGNIADQPYLQELVGGDEPILDFMASSVQNTNMLVDMGLRNLATKNAVMELVELNAAKIVGGKPSGQDVVKFKLDGKDVYAVMDTETVTIGGRKFDTGVPAELLVKGMEGIPTQMPVFFRALAMPSQLLRKTVTLSPLYMAKQLFRDSLAAPLLSGADFTPVAGALRTINSATKGVLERRGIVGGQQFQGTSEDMAMILREIADGKPGWMAALSKVEAMGMEADALTRRAQYNSYIQQGLSEMEATLMTLESMNFSKRGASPSIHAANALIPFLNAQIQGLNVLYQAFTGNMPFNDKLKIQQKLLTRGGMIAVASLVYAAAMGDDEAYKNANPEEKYGNWFIRVPGVDEPVRLPVPFEVGYIFKSLPEALYNTMTSEHGGSEAVKALGTILLQTIPGGSSMPSVTTSGGLKIPVGPPLPQAMKPAVEVALGKSFYTGRDILSAREKELLPEEQFRANTSEIAKLIGKELGVSPIMMETLVRDYTGTLGLAFLHTLSLGAPKSESPEAAVKRLSEFPLVGGAFQANDAGGIINSAYERFNEDIKVRATYKKMVAEGRVNEANSLLQRRSAEIMEAELGDVFKQNMTKLIQAERAIAASTLSPEDKRKQLDEIRRIKIGIARSMREAADRTRPQ